MLLIHSESCVIKYQIEIYVHPRACVCEVFWMRGYQDGSVEDMHITSGCVEVGVLATVRTLVWLREEEVN
jgi:hypothetical protein